MAQVPGNASEDTLLRLTGAKPIGPAAAIAFTADDPAVPLSVTSTAFPAGFVVQNQGSSTMYVWDDAVAGVGTGIAIVAGGVLPIASSDASLWYAYAAAPCAGFVGGTQGGF